MFDPESKLAAQSLSAGYAADQVIENLDLTIRGGSITAVIGPNGAGKSSLLKALARKIKSTRGAVLLDGVSISSLSRAALDAKIGLLGAMPAARGNESVFELIARSAMVSQQISRVSPRLGKEVDEIIERTGLTRLRDKKIGELSTGSKQVALIAAALVTLLTIFFQKTATGRALRAVADDHQAAQSIGIPLNRIWVIVWCVAGIVALVAGMIWGSKLGVQFSLATVALRALPVVILGGLTSVPGAIIGGLIIGVGEKLSEVYLGGYVGGGIEIWFAYVLALGFLLIRPQGLFGEKIIDRV